MLQIHKVIRNNGTILYIKVKQEHLFILLLYWIHLELSSLICCLVCKVILCGGKVYKATEL